MVEHLLEPLHYQFIWRGILLCALLGVSGGLLGCVLVLRRMALMGDALSHTLLPGIGIAYLLFGQSVPSLLLGALTAGILTAAGSSLISRLTRIKEDAAFGALFILSFALGIALLSRAHTRMDLLHFLFGNVLGVTASDLWLATGASTLTLLAFALFYRDILLETFDAAFYRASGRRRSLAHFGIMTLVVINLVAALQALGVVLALGLFLLPAVTAYLWCDRWGSMLTLSVLCAVIGSIGGLLTSYHANIASGACIVGVLGIAFLLSALLSPRYGILARLITPHTHLTEQDDEMCEAVISPLESK